MKNVHLLPTDKPSRLWKNNLLQGKLELSEELLPYNTSQNIYITSDEEIKEGDWIFANQGVHEVIDIKNDKYPYGTLNHKGDKIYHHKSWKKIILTTDQDLIKDGVQAIDDKFLEWFVKNPSCEEVEVKKGKLKFNDDGEEYGFPDMSLYKIIIPKEELTISDEAKQRAKNYMSLKGALEPKQETLEEAADRLAKKYGYDIEGGKVADFVDGVVRGAEWQAERMYSEEEVFNLLCKMPNYFKMTIAQQPEAIKDWFEQFKKK